jgi:hypothetical protein
MKSAIHVAVTLLALLQVPGTTGATAQPAPEAPAPESGFPSDMDLLVRTNGVASAAYWRENAVRGKQCDGAKVAELLTHLARVFEPASNIAQALAVLERRKIIRNDYWAKQAVPGKHCEGQYVANLIHEAAAPLAEVELVARYKIPSGVAVTAEPSAFALMGIKGGSKQFNYIIGTQTFGASYQFTKEPRLIETAEAIRALGSTVIKFELAPSYASAHGNVTTPIPSVHSLIELARDEPSHRKVLDMPFAHFVLWVGTFASGESNKWRQGFAKEDAEKEYLEVYDLAAHLLKTYSGTGKTFYLGHWEGDGYLRGSVAPENDAKVTPVAAQGMADWLNTRQRAVDDAKRDTPHREVAVWHYTEVNHVKLAMQGRPALVNEVLPKTNVDLVSYSSYDTQANPAMLKAALTFIESKLRPKPGITGRRVFIGEYGFPAIHYSPVEQDRLSREVMRAGIEWGCPLILYWELYNNEVEADGKQRGFWMIDDKGEKQPIWHTHQRYYELFKAWVTKFQAVKHRQPTSAEHRAEAVKWLAGGK